MARNLTNTNLRVKQHTHAMSEITGLETKIQQIETNITSSTVEVVDNVTSTDTNKALSANQGKLLKDEVSSIRALLNSNDVNLDTIQEIVDRVKVNKSLLDSLTADNLTGLAEKLAAKQDIATLDRDVAALNFMKTTAFTKEAIENLLGYKAKKLTLTFANGREATVEDAIITEGSFVDFNMPENVNGYVEYLVEAGRITARSDKDENMTVTVSVTTYL